MPGKIHEPRILYPVKLTFKNKAQAVINVS